MMHARLNLNTLLRNRQTLLGKSFVTPPLKLLAMPPQKDGMLRAVQMSSSPGLLAGDVIDTDIEIHAGCSLSLYTQSFTRVLSMSGGTAAQHTRIRQHDGSCLCYLPHPLVLHRGSALVQETGITLGEQCRLLYGEIIAAGRVLNHEKFAFSRLSSRLGIRYRNQELFADNIQWQPGRHAPDVLGQMEHHTHQMNLFYADTGSAAAGIRLKTDLLYEKLAAAHPCGPNLLWGLSQANEHVLCIRALSGNAQSLQTLLKNAAFLLHEQQNSPLNAAFFH